MAVECIPRNLWNDVVSNRRRYRRDPQPQNIVCVPPGHIGFRQSGNWEQVGNRTDEITKQDEQQSCTEKPHCDIQSLGLAIQHRHPDVDCKRDEDEQYNVNIQRPNQVLIFATRRHAVDQCEKDCDHADVPGPAIPQTQSLAP